jgi:hypothetical protein
MSPKQKQTFVDLSKKRNNILYLQEQENKQGQKNTFIDVTKLGRGALLEKFWKKNNNN